MADSKQKSDGKRGLYGRDGRWIDSNEAERLWYHASKPEIKWWTKGSLDGKKVEVKHYASDGPADKVFWLYANGDMYLGDWTTPQNEDCHPLEQGFGIKYNNEPENEMKGLVCIGNFEGGLLNGYGRSFWLMKSKIWRENHLPLSPIWTKVGNNAHAFPFQYEGEFQNSARSGMGKVYLKGGADARGQWKDGSPVGKWWESLFQRKAWKKNILLPLAVNDQYDSFFNDNDELPPPSVGSDDDKDIRPVPSHTSEKRKVENDDQQIQRQVRRKEETSSAIKQEEVLHYSISDNSAAFVPASIEIAPDKPKGVLSEIADLETKIGINHLNHSNIIERLAHLEIVTYGAASTGGLIPRLNALKEALLGSS